MGTYVLYDSDYPPEEGPPVDVNDPYGQHPAVTTEPVGACSACGRKAWDLEQLGTLDKMHQPDGKPCGGIFRGRCGSPTAGR
jgi:hypothetical protein